MVPSVLRRCRVVRRRRPWRSTKPFGPEATRLGSEHRFRRLLQAARGHESLSDEEHLEDTNVLLPYFVLRQSHLGSLWQEHRPHRTPSATRPESSTTRPTPREFHATLCEAIRTARHRVILSSLYIGSSSCPTELELLNALEDAAASDGVTVQILLDENRALRKVKKAGTGTPTSFAQAVQERLERGWERRKQEKALRKESHDFTSQESSAHQDAVGLYLFNVLKEPYKSLLPSPIDEGAGVFHAKAYIVDDSLILSGANLSEEYFVDRQDRYMHIEKGGGGLVDFYAKLVNALTTYSRRYHGPPIGSTWSSWGAIWKSFGNNHAEEEKGKQLQESLEALFASSVDEEKEVDCPTLKSENGDEVVALVVPTFQAPQGFFSKRLGFPSDVMVTEGLLKTARKEADLVGGSASLYMASAYLNPTPRSLSTVLSQFDRLVLLTAGFQSHGFAPKPGKSGYGRGWIPLAYADTVAQLAAQMKDKDEHQVWLYERWGWTFHSKGLWIAVSEKEEKKKKASPFPQDLVAGVVGSGNYGRRSEVLDLESNCILVFPPTSKSHRLRRVLCQEWKDACQYAKPYQKDKDENSPSGVRRWLFRIMNRYL